MNDKIKSFLKTNWALKAGSVLCALILWLVVINLTDPTEEKTLLRVPVTVLNDQAITNSGRVYDITEGSTIDVVCSAKKTNLNAIRTSDFYAYVDMRYSYGTEEDLKAVRINVRIADTSENKDKILEFRASTDVMYFTTEDVITKTYNIEVIPTGEVAEGFELDGTLVANPGKVEVTGPESAFANVNKAAVTVDVSGFDGENSVLTAPVVLYDGNGKPVNNSELSVNVAETSVSAEVLRTKEVKIDVAGVSGTPAEGFVYSGVLVDIPEVTVAGLRADLANINSIIIPAEALNMDGITENRVIEVDITPYLPENIRVLETSNLVIVTIQVEPLQKKTVRIPSSRIVLEGEEAGLLYDLAETCLVMVKGLQDDLDALDQDEIFLYLDVSGVEEGEYSLNVRVDLPDGYSLSEDSVIRVVVTKETEEETSEESGEDESLNTSPETEAVPARLFLQN